LGESIEGIFVYYRCAGGTSVYYEPHASFDGADLARADDVDMVISPAAEIKFGGCFTRVELMRGGV
jgi:hypothetical protein